jgi:hypothetical protein
MTLASLILLGASVSLARSSAQAQTPDVASLYRQFIEAINRGDVASAVGLMTDDARLQGTPGCLMSACRGKAAVRQDLEQDVAGHLQIQSLGTLQVSENSVKANTAHRADVLKGAGLSRVIINETFTFQAGKISSIVFEPEATDPQTATLVRLLTSGPPSPPPAPRSVEPAPIRPPSTGNGGLPRPGA